ncbi:MAG: nicotinate phosphoribosyltransferase [Phycisphaeraceae bacterium]
MNDPPCVGPFGAALFTDLYELTMVQAYDAQAMCLPAVFELSFRKLPECRNYLVACGLQDVLTYLEQAHFSDDDLAYLRRQGGFRDTFLNRLSSFRFTGDVFAVPEGTMVFENEPVLQVIAPLPEAQLIETFVINQVHFQSLVATKAARVVTAAAGRTVVDFGARRAHGTDAAMKVARASYIAGAAGTSNVLAGKTYDIPIFGTMAHSYIQAHDDELAAFAAFAGMYPQTTLLVDTYDTIEGVRKVVELSRRLGDRFRVRAVRLDSGDLLELSRKARAILDEAGLNQVRVFASGGLDEYQIADLVQRGAAIDGFGVGTKLAVSSDAPDVDVAYKLVEYAGQPRLKLSSEKIIIPGRKQVFRVIEDGRLLRDVIGRHDEKLDGRPLLKQVMHNGRRLPAERASLDQSRKHARRELEQLPPPLLKLERAEQGYPVQLSAALKADGESLRRTRDAPPS